MSAPIATPDRALKTHVQPPARWQKTIGSPAYADLPPLRAEMRRFLDLAGIPAATSDRYCLSLCEIISNLVKHPRQKAQAVAISCTAAGAHLRLDVADDSTPFASFDAICKGAPARLHAAGTLAESGYGLGCIVAQHARVCYTSAAASADGRNHFTLEDGAPAAAPQSAPKPLVFLVDDNPADLKMHHRMLSGFYDVVPLGDAMAAMAMFDARRPDLIISDLHMPGTDGAALRRRISALPDGDTVPFIFLSAAAEGMNDANLLRLGIDDYIVKPATSQALQRTAERVLRRREQVHRALESRFHRDVQKYLHPHLPPQAGRWRIALKNRMADAGGGDFTLHSESEDSLSVILADVMGHGTEAKFFAYAYAGYLRSLFRGALAPERGLAPAAPHTLLTMLSAAVAADDFLDASLLTCQSFRLAQDGAVTIASAGHPPPLLLPRRAAPSVLPVAGALPGLAGADYQPLHLQLAAGDKIIFATDGFFDAFSAEGEAHPPAALMQMLDACAPMGAEDCSHEIWQRFEFCAQTQTRPPDDATLIIAAYGGSDEHQ